MVSIKNSYPAHSRTLIFCLLVAVSIFVPMIAQAGPIGDRIRERIEERRNQNVSEDPSGRDGVLSDRQTQVETITVDGLVREYRLFVPSSARNNAPLIIMLHGTYGSGEKMQRALGFDAYAREQGFLMAYPDAYKPNGERKSLRWNDGRGSLDSSKKDVNDVAFIAAMIDQIADKHNIDRNRVFVTGASNGGMMTYRLGCELHGKIRAIAPEIANLPKPLAASCNPLAGLSVLSINGSADPFIPLNGGEVCAGVSKRFCEGGEILSRADSMTYFARANECELTPSSRRRTPVAEDGTKIEELDYGACRSSAVVRSIVVHGMGHVWPPRGGQLGEKSGSTSQNLDATKEVVQFFMNIK